MVINEKLLQNWTNPHFDYTPSRLGSTAQYTPACHTRYTSSVFPWTSPWTIQNQWVWCARPYPGECSPVSDPYRWYFSCANTLSLRVSQRRRISPRLMGTSCVCVISRTTSHRVISLLINRVSLSFGMRNAVLRWMDGPCPRGYTSLTWCVSSRLMFVSLIWGLSSLRKISL